MKLVWENFPPSLAMQRETHSRCLDARDRTLPLCAEYFFGSHACGDTPPDSDVDLCLVTDGVERQLEAAQEFRRAMPPLRGTPSFTRVPISPARLEEKKAIGDHFFETVLKEGVPISFHKCSRSVLCSQKSVSPTAIPASILMNPTGRSCERKSRRSPR